MQILAYGASGYSGFLQQLEKFLAQQQWHVVCCESLIDIQHTLKFEKPDAMFLCGADAVMVKKIRQKHDQFPVVCMDKNSSPQKIIEMLNAGADHCQMLPVTHADFSVLRAYALPIILRHKGYPGVSVLEIGALKLDVRSQQVRVNDTDLHLTEREYKVLEKLCLEAGKILSKEEILNHVYSLEDNVPDLKIIDVYVSKLRQKLERAGVENFITTEWNRGYQLKVTQSFKNEQCLSKDFQQASVQDCDVLSSEPRVTNSTPSPAHKAPVPVPSS